MPCLKLLATSRRRSNSFQAAAANKGSLKVKTLFRLPYLVNSSQTFGATASPLRPAERSILFSGKSVRCPTAHEVRLVRTRRKKDAE
ncbi:hypothetical protein [Kingella oralis]|uniref:hypothetical protein n=1 Tax=Kingella oralis TaxID=505 RepID=UPI0028E99722|nr:hypothetical protein [Kingella oralis]